MQRIQELGRSLGDAIPHFDTIEIRGAQILVDTAGTVGRNPLADLATTEKIALFFRLIDESITEKYHLPARASFAKKRELMPKTDASDVKARHLYEIITKLRNSVNHNVKALISDENKVEIKTREGKLSLTRRSFDNLIGFCHFFSLGTKVCGHDLNLQQYIDRIIHWYYEAISKSMSAEGNFGIEVTSHVPDYPFIAINRSVLINPTFNANSEVMTISPISDPSRVVDYLIDHEKGKFLIPKEYLSTYGYKVKLATLSHWQLS